MLPLADLSNATAALAVAILLTGFDAYGRDAGTRRAATPAGNRPLADEYRETPGTHSERPGKHSTTVGRHGTAGTVGGGVDEQSGTSIAPSDRSVLQRRQQEEHERRRPDEGQRDE